MKKFVSSLGVIILVMYVVFRIHDPLEIYDTFVNFVIETSRTVTVVDKLWQFIVSPVVYIHDHILNDFLGDIFTGKGVWGALLEWIFGGK